MRFTEGRRTGRGRQKGGWFSRGGCVCDTGRASERVSEPLCVLSSLHVLSGFNSYRIRLV